MRIHPSLLSRFSRVAVVLTACVLLSLLTPLAVGQYDMDAFTKRGTYEPGDTVSLSVEVSNRSLVVVQVRDPDGTIIYVDTNESVHLDMTNHSKGWITVFEFRLAENCSEGNASYAVSATVNESDDRSFMMGSFTVVVSRNRNYGDELEYPIPPVPVIAGLLVVVCLVGITLVSDQGRYVLFSIFFIPLYSRLHGDVENDVLQQNNRGRIYQFVKDRPGASLKLIKEGVETGNGTTIYHLRVLIREGRIVKCGNHYFIQGAKPQIFNSLKRPLTRREISIMNLLGMQGPMDERSICSVLCGKQSTVNRDINTLVRHHIISREKGGNIYKYSLSGELIQGIDDNSQPLPQSRAESCGICHYPIQHEGLLFCMNCGNRLR